MLCGWEVKAVADTKDHARGAKGVWTLCPQRGCRRQSPRWGVWGRSCPEAAGIVMHLV